MKDTRSQTYTLTLKVVLAVLGTLLALPPIVSLFFLLWWLGSS